MEAMLIMGSGMALLGIAFIILDRFGGKVFRGGGLTPA